MRPRLRIKADRRLVEKQNRRIVDEPPRDFEPPLHPAGKSLDDIISSILELDKIQHFIHSFFVIAHWNSIETRVKSQIFFCGEPIIERRILKNKPDRFSHIIAIR